MLNEWRLLGFIVAPAALSAPAKIAAPAAAVS